MRSFFIDWAQRRPRLAQKPIRFNLDLLWPGLAGRLAIVMGALLILAVAAVASYGVGSLRELAESEALTRVELGASASREGLRQTTEDLLTAARILGERPPLLRLLGQPARDGVPSYLGRYCPGAGIDACAVVERGRVTASSDDTIAWDVVLTAATDQGERFLVTGAVPGYALGGAHTRVPERPGVSVLAVRRLDEGMAARLGERTGLAIGIVDYASYRPGEGPLGVLNTDALSRGETVAALVPDLDAYVASLPVEASTGEIIALLQARLPAAQVMRAVESRERRMRNVALFIAILAIASTVLIGRYWISAVAGLTDAAQRLASGDLATAIPIGGGKELTRLGQTMDQMRRNLVELTSELRLRESQAQAVLGGIIEGIYAVDDARRIRFINPQAEKLLKVPAAEALGQFCGDVLKPERDAKGRRPCEVSCPIIRARRVGAAHAVERIAPVEGSPRRVVIASAAAADGLQVQVLRDETELEAVRRTRDTVLANISHEFRTPLAAQLASIELLKDGIGTMKPRAQRELVSSLQRGTQRLTWLIDNLLESVRIESGQLAIRNQEVLFDEVVLAARELIEPLIEQRGQRIEVRLGPGVPVIRGDQQRLTQVLVNLLANASKFGPRDTTITIGASAAAGGGLVFYVEDEGEGPFDPNDTGIFEQFHRSGGEDPDESGLGLGLFIVRSIIERHGGTVTLNRTEAGRTRAEVLLPKEAPGALSSVPDARA